MTGNFTGRNLICAFIWCILLGVHHSHAKMPLKPLLKPVKECLYLMITLTVRHSISSARKLSLAFALSNPARFLRLSLRKCCFVELSVFLNWALLSKCV